MFKTIALTTLTVLVLAAVGCSGGGDDDDRRRIGDARRNERWHRNSNTTAGQPTPSVDIREIDIAAMPDVQAVLTTNGGTIIQTDVVYADVTGDGFDDAIVPVSSGGTLGYLGFFVVTPEGDTARILMQEFPAESTGLTVTVVGEKIELLQPAPGPDDPECCPSFFRRTIYAWNGNALAVESVTTELNPDVAAALTPESTE